MDRKQLLSEVIAQETLSLIHIWHCWTFLLYLNASCANYAYYFNIADVLWQNWRTIYYVCSYGTKK